MPKYLTIDKMVEFGKRLQVLDPVLESFCNAHGYANAQAELGTFPQRRLRKSGEVGMVIEFLLDRNQAGDYNEEFAANSPFRFNWVMFTELGSVHIRIDWDLAANPVQFSVLKAELANYLELAHSTMACITLEELIRDGIKIDRKAKFTLEDAQRYSAQIRSINA
jgi:hypothetical protein